MINAIQEIFGPPETWNYMDEANPGSPVSSCSYFYFKAFCISPSIYSFSCLFLWPFVLEQLCGRAYIMRNPAWQWEQERDGKKPFLPSINYYRTCLRLHSFLLSPVLLCFLTYSDVDLQKLDEAVKKRRQMSCWPWKQQVINAFFT